MAQVADSNVAKDSTSAGSAPAELQSEDTAQARELRWHRAQAIVRRHVYWALGVGIVPLPIVDIIGLTAIELRMVKELSESYGVSFAENTAKGIVTSLAVSIGSLGIAGAVANSVLKLFPGLGMVVSVIGLSVLAGAFTQALGSTFIMHFESGGTLLDFNPDKMRMYFVREYEKSKVSVAQLQKEEQKKAAGTPAS